MAEHKDSKRLGDILVSRGIINKEQLAEALEEQRVTKRLLGEVLTSRGVVTEEKIAQVLSEQLGFAFVDLVNMIIEPKAAELLNQELCHKYTAMPLFITQNTLTVAMSNPLDVQAIDELQLISKMRVKPVFASATAIRNSIERQYQAQQLPNPQIQQSQSTISAATLQQKEIPAEQLNNSNQSMSPAPIIETVDSIIANAVKMNASDIHLEPERDGFISRYRIDGVLYQASKIPLQDQPAVISRIKIMANMDIAETRLPQDGRIQTLVLGKDVDLRVSTFPTIYGENVVVRILSRSQGILKLDQLGFSKEALNSFSELIQKPYGIVLVTGPTGSGKTTTLYVALNQINSQEKNIITLEDPVEYELKGIRQSQVNIKAGLTFAKGLRSIVRQDPDIIMIGEIRDRETADIAIHAALTGHLVFSTLHTNDAPSSATRLIDMGIEPFLVASSVMGILAQRLVRTLCSFCKKAYTPSAELLKQLGIIQSEQDLSKYTFYQEAGCNKCNQRGYLGRIGIFELLIPTDLIKELITQRSSSMRLREEAIKAGMMTLRQSGVEKVIAGVTSVSELLRVTEDI